MTVIGADFREGDATKLTILALRKPHQLQSQFGPFGPEIPKESKTSQKKSLPGPPVPGVLKVRRESKKDSKRVIFDSFLTRF